MSFRFLSLVSLLLASTLSACAGVEWVKTVDGDGKVTYNAMNEKDRAKHQQGKLTAAERLERIAAAPKRQPTDTIMVAIYPMDLRDGLAENTKGRMWKAYRKHFDGHSIIRSVRQKEVDRELERAKQFRREADIATDVTVRSSAWLEKKSGITKSGKLGQATVLMFGAKIRSSYGTEVYEIEHSSSLFKNEEGLAVFAKKVQAVITDKVGPTIPADAWQYRKGVNAEEAEAFKDWVDKLKSDD